MGKNLETNIELQISFDVIFDTPFQNIVLDKTLAPVSNKWVVSIINDYENGAWRYQKFEDFIWDNIALTALSEIERESLVDKSHSTLRTAAKKLRLTDKTKTDKGEGSEIAEIVLYGIMKHYYKALPVVPKIFYKQNNQDFAKGADSVHIVIEKNNDFSIWFGEAKFYNTIEDSRLDKIILSVENSLHIDKLKHENSIITSVSDIDQFKELDEKLLKKIKALLSNETSIDVIKPRLHIPILLLHECDITQSNNSITNNYLDSIKKHHKERAESYFKKQIKKLNNKVHKYSEIMFHLILFPIPEKNKIVDKFIKTAQNYNS